jgi:hypothetical protein
MNLPALRRLWPGLLGVAWLAAAPAADAFGPPPPFRIDANINYRVNVKVGPQAYVPRAPWYTYFPVDPQMLARQTGTAYPPWPGQSLPGNPGIPTQGFPVPPPEAPEQAPPGTPPANPPAGRVFYQPGGGWMTPAGYGPSVQPVGYAPTQVPSYWYGR